jgi:hypothetical protein
MDVYNTPLYPQKLALNFANKWPSLGVVRLWTKGHGVCFCFMGVYNHVHMYHGIVGSVVKCENT